MMRRRGAILRLSGLRRTRTRTSVPLEASPRAHKSFDGLFLKVGQDLENEGVVSHVATVDQQEGQQRESDGGVLPGFFKAGVACAGEGPATMANL